MFAKLTFNTAPSLDIVPKVWYTMIVPNVLGRYYTLAKWLFKEDYIVCKFCQAQNGDDIIGERLDELILRLSEAGFELRSKDAIRNRAREFTYLLRGWDSPYATEQILNVYEAVRSEPQMQESLKWIEKYIGEIYSINVVANTVDNLTEDTSPRLIRLLPIDKPETHGSFYEIFRELLDRYYEKNRVGKETIGSVKRRFRENLIRLYGVKINTFEAIQKGKYKSVSNEILYRLFFAMELDYVDAKRLLESIAADFKHDNIFDCTVKAILKSNSPRRFVVTEIDETLMKYSGRYLFTADDDELESIDEDELEAMTKPNKVE